MTRHVYILMAAVVAALLVVALLKASSSTSDVEVDPRTCDPTSGSGFVPSTWGPGAWKLIHLTAAGFPMQPTHQDRESFKMFLNVLGNHLPCPGCRHHFKTMLNDMPLTVDVLANRFSLFEYTVRMHNEVNKRLNKKVDTDAKKWFQFYCRDRADYGM